MIFALLVQHQRVFSSALLKFTTSSTSCTLVWHVCLSVPRKTRKEESAWSEETLLTCIALPFSCFLVMSQWPRILLSSLFSHICYAHSSFVASIPSWHVARLENERWAPFCRAIITFQTAPSNASEVSQVKDSS